MKKLLMSIVAVSLFAIPAICSEIDGQWVGVVDGMDGNKLELTYRFRAEGNTLIGLIESRLGGGPISDGKIDGNNIEFTLNTGEFIILM